MGCSPSCLHRPTFEVSDARGQDATAYAEFTRVLRLHKPQIDKLWRSFLRVDKNGDQVISQSEFLTAFRLDHSPFFERLFTILCGDDKERVIDFRQFVRAVYHFSSLDYGGVARLVFDSIADDRGVVHLTDLRRLSEDMLTVRQSSNPQLRRKLSRVLSPDSHSTILSGDVTFDAFCKFAEATPAILDQVLHIQSNTRDLTLGHEEWQALSVARVARGDAFASGLAMFDDPMPKRVTSWWLPSPSTSPSSTRSPTSVSLLGSGSKRVMPYTQLEVHEEDIVTPVDATGASPRQKQPVVSDPADGITLVGSVNNHASAVSV